MSKQPILAALALGALLAVGPAAVAAQENVHLDRRNGTLLRVDRPAAAGAVAAESPHLVREVVPGAAEGRVLWRGEHPVLDVSASPDGRYLALLEKVWNEAVEPSSASYRSESVGPSGERTRFSVYEDQVLRILDRSGGVLLTVHRVRRYAWSPDGTRLAYIVGDFYEGGAEFTDPRTFVVDVASARTRELGVAAFDLHWARFDGNLYLRRWVWAPGATVHRYDPEGEQVEPTDRRGIHFSPDGRLYYAAGREGDRFRLFRTSDDREITDELPFLANPAGGPVQALGWFDEETLILVSSLPGPRTDLLYRVGAGEARRVDGEVVAPLSGGAEVLVLQDGETKVVPVAALDTVGQAPSRQELKR